MTDQYGLEGMSPLRATQIEIRGEALARAVEIACATLDDGSTTEHAQKVIMEGTLPPPQGWDAQAWGNFPPEAQPCGAYREPSWFASFPSNAKLSNRWLVCAKNAPHPAAPHITSNQTIFSTHHQVAFSYADVPACCACGDNWPAHWAS